MGFDDLAKHMAGRDKRKLNTAASADELVADAARADRRMTRTRDLILGPVLLVGGLTLCVLFYVLYSAELKAVTDPHSSENTFYYSIGGAALAVGMLIQGSRQTLRGLRARA
jgi:hypothetical protein